jgi:hypothetical protein
MNIVCSSLVSRNFEFMKEFQRDLGFTLTQDMKNGNGPLRTVIKIRDPFVRHYFEFFSCYPNKHGTIGKIGVYIDPKIPNDKIKLFDDDKEYSFYFDRNSVDNMRNYISGIIGEIESGSVKSNEVEMDMDGTIEFYVDPNLPPDQYMEEFIKQKRKMEELNLLK